MTTVCLMSWDVYAAHSSAIAAAVDSLLDDQKLFKRWQLLTIYEDGERKNEPPIGQIVEFPEIHPGAVILFRIPRYDADSNDLEDHRQSSLRMLQPITGEPKQAFELASRRAQFRVEARYLIQRIEAGDRKVSLKPGLTVCR